MKKTLPILLWQGFQVLPGNNGTGSLAPGSPGDADGERTGSGVGENDLSEF